MSFRQLLPTAVTMVALASGLGAIEAARGESWDIALRLILLAAIADGIDGPLARSLGVTSTMGEQLDSLADIVAFGVAPAFLYMAYYERAPDPVRFAVALAFVLAAAYRLARFHAEPADGVFNGLPITAAGPLLATTVAGPFNAGAREAGVVAVGLAALMASHHPFPKLAQARRWLLPATAVAALPVMLWPRVETLAVLAVLIFGIYVVWGLIHRDAEEDVREGDEEVRAVVESQH